MTNNKYLNEFLNSDVVHKVLPFYRKSPKIDKSITKDMALMYEAFRVYNRESSNVHVFVVTEETSPHLAVALACASAWECINVSLQVNYDVYVQKLIELNIARMFFMLPAQKPLDVAGDNVLVIFPNGGGQINKYRQVATNYKRMAIIGCSYQDDISNEFVTLEHKVSKDKVLQTFSPNATIHTWRNVAIVSLENL